MLLTNEGADPTNPRVRSIAWLFVHRPEAVYVAGERTGAPHYRFVASVPEGQYEPERRQAMVHDITEAVLDAEHGAHERDPGRVWVFTPEVPDGTWGASAGSLRSQTSPRSPPATLSAAAPTPKSDSVRAARLRPRSDRVRAGGERAGSPPAPTSTERLPPGTPLPQRPPDELLRRLVMLTHRLSALGVCPGNASFLG